MGLLGDVEHGHPLGLDPAVGVGGGESAADVGVHTVAGNIFPDLMDDQHVRLRDQNPAHVGLGLQEQLRFLLRNGLRGHGPDNISVVVGVFHDGQAEQQLGILNNGLAELGHRLRHVAETLGVAVVRPRLLGQADG